MKNLIKAIKLVPKTWRSLFIALIINLVYALLATVRPYLFSRIINTVVSSVNHGSFSKIWLVITPLLIITLIAGLGTAFLDGLNSLWGNRIYDLLITQLRQTIYDRMLSHSIDFFESQKSGEVFERITKGIDQYTDWIISMVTNFLGALLITIVIVTLLWVKDPIIGLITTVLLIVNVVVYNRVAKQSAKLNKKISKHSEATYAHMTESFTQTSTIRSLSAEKAVRDKFIFNNQKAYDYSVDASKLWFWRIVQQSGISQINLVVCMALAVWSVTQHQLSIGDIVLVALYLQTVNSQVNSLARFFIRTSLADVQVGRLIEILEIEPSMQDAVDAKPLDNINSIEFRNVSFSYPRTEKGAIHNISFRLTSGQTLALVGPSGVGKSTITKLLMRFYEPTEGEILINNEAIDSFRSDSIRAHIGVVMQDVALFNTSVEENIIIVRRGANRDELEEAAAQAHATEFIDQLPKQYKTLVGERGIKLSGGQKQRIAIARAILKDPQLIILDEATSALDSESERLVQDGLRKLMKGRSALVIAHRLSTIMHADQIIVLKNGRIHESGDHRSLLKKDGLYAKLFKLQSATGRIEL